VINDFISSIKDCTTNRETLAEDLEWYILSYIEKCARVQDLEELFTVKMPLIPFHIVLMSYVC
jgi:hypothetical protein